MEKTEQARQLISQAIELIGIFSVYALIGELYNKKVAVKFLNFL